jgi:hypothetical protein
VRSRAIVVAICVVGSAACSAGGPALVTPFELSNHEWRQVYLDAQYQVSVDVANVRPGPEPDSLEVWYQTRHLEPREYNGVPWNREVIHSLLRCDPLSFKTVLTTIFLDDGPPVAQIGGDLASVADNDWRPTASGSVDEGAMRGACSTIARLDIAP